VKFEKAKKLKTTTTVNPNSNIAWASTIDHAVQLYVMENNDNNLPHPGFVCGGTGLE